MNLLLIAIGGGLGAVAWYGLTSAIQARPGSAPYAGTLAVNVAGCLAIGVLAHLLSGPWPVRDEIRAALILGLLGGFTTFSSFAFESVSLFATGARAAALWNVLLSNGLGLTAAWAGYALALRLWPGGGA